MSFSSAITVHLQKPPLLFSSSRWCRSEGDLEDEVLVHSKDMLKLLYLVAMKHHILATTLYGFKVILDFNFSMPIGQWEKRAGVCNLSGVARA